MTSGVLSPYQSGLFYAYYAKKRREIEADFYRFRTIPRKKQEDKKDESKPQIDSQSLLEKIKRKSKT